MWRRRFLLLAFAAAVALGFGVLLNRISYDPSFSALDALTSPSKKAEGSGTAVVNGQWAYTIEDFQLSESEGNMEEQTVTVENTTYVVLQRRGLDKDATLRFLSNRQNEQYQDAVQTVADYYGKKGYAVSIENCSELMLQSYAHAGRFDVIVLREEAAS